MLKGLVIWTMIMSVNGTEITRVGPYGDYASCEMMEKTVRTLVEKSFATDSTYGVSFDKWNVGGGAIIRFSDYDFKCTKIELE